jgi:hypothetical protein
MNSHYRPLRSGKWSLAAAVTLPVLLAVGVYLALDWPSIPLPIAVAPPDTALRHTKTELLYRPTPTPKAPPAVVIPKSSALRALGPGVFKCEDSNGAVTYSQYPCDDGKLVDTRPTSGGFSDQWSISVKRAE